MLGPCLIDKGLDARTRPRLLEHCEKGLRKAEALEDRQAGLLRLEKAIRGLDVKWLNRTSRISLTQLTPDQQSLMKRTVDSERKRTRAGEELETLQTEVERHTRALGEHLKKCRDCLLSWNVAGAAGWLTKALQEEQKTEKLERQILGWEKELTKLLSSRRQRSFLQT